MKVSTKKTRTVPAWAGGQMALSDLLTHHLRLEVDRASRGDLDNAELQALKPLFDRQQDISVLPTVGQLLICLLYTSPSPRDRTRSRMPSSA